MEKSLWELGAFFKDPHRRPGYKFHAMSQIKATVFTTDRGDKGTPQIQLAYNIEGFPHTNSDQVWEGNPAWEDPEGRSGNIYNRPKY